MVAGLLLHQVSASECLLGFALKGLDPFESTEWVGLSVCDSSRAGCEVVTNVCLASYFSILNCFWSIVDDGSDADDDGACSCQSCGGLPSDMDEYMTELSFWDRARCAIYALEITGFDGTPCVEALVDDRAMPGVNDTWTASAVSRFDCLTVTSSYSDDPECSYPADTPRLATEVFDGSDTSTPAPGSTASPAIAATVSESTVECLLGFALQGLDPFESMEWVGLSVCDGSRAGCEVVTNVCLASYFSILNCFWSIVDDGSDADDDGACSCQSCGGLPSDMDEYMTELSFWDRARCAIYALEITGFDATPCIEALVDDKAMPGVNDTWTASAVSRFDCLTVASSYTDDPECSYPADPPRLATEVFDGSNTSTPAPGSTASPAIAATVSESTVECLLGFALQGLDPFESMEWVGLSVCDGSRAGCEVVTNVCLASYFSILNCFWSIVDDGSDADDDGACSCQSCGGLPSDMDEYMTELSFWDRARCAIYALEITGYDVTPCVEALVDDRAMPGVNDTWTASAVSRFDCLTVASSYSDDPECSYPADTPRLATEVFDGSDTSTPAPGMATPGPAQPSLDEVKTTPWPTAVSSGILEWTLDPTIGSTAGPAAHPSYSGAKSDGTFDPVDAGSLDPLGVSPSESMEVSSSGPIETVYSDSLGGSSSVTANSSSSTSGSYSDAVDRDIDDGESTSSESSGNNVFEIVIGIASVLVAIAGIIVGVRYRT